MPQQPGGMPQQPGGMQQQPGWGQQQPAWGQAVAGRRSSMAPLLILLLVVLLAGLGGLVYYYFGDELTGMFSSSTGTGTGTGNGTGATANTTDTTPPVISDIYVISVSSSNTTAVIGWATDELASSQVEYGTTYEDGEIIDGTLTTLANDPTTDESIGVTTHSAELTGLTYGTNYYYKLMSKDAAGNEAEEADVFKQEPSSE